MNAPIQRFGRVLRLREGREADYDRLHAAVWPEVLAAIRASGIRNYTIFRYQRWLFSYFELTDELSFEDAGRRYMQPNECRRWEAIMQELQEPLPESIAGQWWVPMNEVFHLDGSCGTQ